MNQYSCKGGVDNLLQAKVDNKMTKQPKWMENPNRMRSTPIEKVVWAFMVLLYGGTLLGIVLKCSGHWKGF